MSKPVHWRITPEMRARIETLIRNDPTVTTAILKERFGVSMRALRGIKNAIKAEKEEKAS